MLTFFNVDRRFGNRLPRIGAAGLSAVGLLLLASCRLTGPAAGERWAAAPAALQPRRELKVDLSGPRFARCPPFPTRGGGTQTGRGARARQPLPQPPPPQRGEGGLNRTASLEPGQPSPLPQSPPSRVEKGAGGVGFGAPTFSVDSALAQRLKAAAAEAVARGVTRSVGVAVYDLAANRGAGINPFHPYRPASVIKLAVLVAAYRARPHMKAAEFERLRPDLKQMITVSSNAAARRLVRRLGATAINRTIRDLGLTQFRVGESGSKEWVLMGSKAAPADTALLLAKIARREVVSREACDEMLALLGAQQLRERIPAGLPAAPGLWVGNKTGTLIGVVNDAGIVLEPAKGIAYTLAIFTTGTRSEAAGNQLLADMSALVYGYMASRHHS